MIAEFRGESKTRKAERFPVNDRVGRYFASALAAQVTTSERNLVSKARVAASRVSTTHLLLQGFDLSAKDNHLLKKNEKGCKRMICALDSLYLRTR